MINIHKFELLSLPKIKRAVTMTQPGVPGISKQELDETFRKQIKEILSRND